MDQKYREALILMRHKLLEDIHPQYVAEELNLKQLAEAIKANLYPQPYNAEESEKQRKMYAEKILDILPERGNSAFFKFVRCLEHKCGQKYLSDELKKFVASDDIEINLEELLAPPPPTQCWNENRIRIADLKQSMRGTIVFQVIHKKVTKDTKVGTVFSFFVADDSGGINILAKGNDGTYLTLNMKIKQYYQIAHWGLCPRKSFPSLSNHHFDLWLETMDRVQLKQLPLPGIPFVVTPLLGLNLVSIDAVAVTPAEQCIDVVGWVNKLHKHVESTNSKKMEIKNSKSKSRNNLLSVECVLQSEQCSEVKKQNIIIIIKNAKVTKPFGQDKSLVADKFSYVFVVDENFDELWIPENKRHFVRDLKGKPKSSRSSLPTTPDRSLLPSYTTPNGLNAAPPLFTASVSPQNSPSTSNSCLPQASSPSSFGGGRLPQMFSTPPPPLVVSPSSRNNLTNTTPSPSLRRNLFPPISLNDVPQKTNNANSNRVNMAVQSVNIRGFSLFPYDGCPNDACVKKKEDSIDVPYSCTGYKCKGSPLKQEIKIRYRSVFSLGQGPNILANVKMFDEVVRRLLHVVGMNPQAKTEDEIKASVESNTYTVQLCVSRKNESSYWDYIVEDISLAVGQ